MPTQNVFKNQEQHSSISCRLSTAFSVLFMFCSISIFAQSPQQLLNSWNTNSGNPGCKQWKITFPTGDEEKDLCSNVSSNRREFYYVNSAGNGIVFRAPIRDDNGTTPNSDNVRSELREREIDGGKDVSWTTSGNHVIYVKQAITHLPIRKSELVATQIHGNKSAGIDDAMVVRLEDKKLFLSFNGRKLRSDVTITTNYNLGTTFEVIFQVINGKHYCYYSTNGNLKSAFASGNADQYLVKDGTNAVLMDIDYGEAYFKAGNYTQSNPNEEGSDTGKSNNYGEVIIYDLYVDHNGSSTPGGGGGGSTCNTSAVPGNRHVDDIGTSSATLDWNAVANSDHYNVRWRKTGTSSWSYKTSIRGRTNWTITGLNNNTTYQWQVRSKCPNNQGASYSSGPGPNFKTGSSNTGGGSKIVIIKKRNAQGYAIDGKGGASDGQNVHLWTTNTGNSNQQWIEIDRGGGYYSYQKNNTNHCLDGKGGGANGQNVHLWTCNSNNQNQHWKKQSTSGGAFKLIKRNSQGYAINGGSGGKKGQNVNLYNSSNGSWNLQWVITEINVNYERVADAETTAQLDKESELSNDIPEFGASKQVSIIDDTATVATKTGDDMIIYPNPIGDLFTIEVPNLNSRSQVVLELIELATGKVIHRDNYSQSIFEFDSSSLVSGTYIAKITYEDGQTIVKKMVKM